MLIVKFIMIGIISIVLLPIFSAITTGQALLIAVVLTLVAYYLGDLSILPRYGNVTATALDAVIAAIVIGIADFTFNGAITLTPVGWILTLGALAAGEWFFHKYLKAEPVPTENKTEDKI